MASLIIFSNMFQTQTNSKKVHAQTLNHFANPTLDFTFLQWGLHFFIQIPKVEIICSRCVQSRPAEGLNDFSRAGGTVKSSALCWSIQSERKRRQARGEELGWWSICLCCYLDGSWTRSGKACGLPRSRFLWRGGIYFVMKQLVMNQKKKNGHTIINVARWVRKLISKRFNLGSLGNGEWVWASADAPKPLSCALSPSPIFT